VELTSSRAVGDPAGKGEEATADRLRDEWTGDPKPERPDPAEEVVGDGRERALAREASRGGVNQDGDIYDDAPP
jgi:hypothetical protein